MLSSTRLNVYCHDCVQKDALRHVAKNCRILTRNPGTIPDVEAPTVYGFNPLFFATVVSANACYGTGDMLHNWFVNVARNALPCYGKNVVGGHARAKGQVLARMGVGSTCVKRGGSGVVRSSKIHDAARIEIRMLQAAPRSIKRQEMG
jgi:hypothetical protein